MPETSEVRVDADTLSTLCNDVLIANGVPVEDARMTADCLLWANLRGIDTHGVIRLKVYVDRIKAGGNNPTPAMAMVRENAVSAVLEGDHSLGAVGGTRAMRMAIDKAAESGVGLVTIRNSNHYGAAAYYATMPLAHDMIGVSMTNVLASMPPTGGREARVGNNPVALAIPSNAEPPIVLDIATSKSSWGKVFACAQKGETLPPDCYLDKDGNPTLAPDDILGGGVLLPIADYKGYGMALCISVLTGLLSEARFDPDIPHPYNHLDAPGYNAFFMAAVRVDQFVPIADFKARVDQVVRLMRNTAPAPGTDRIWLPGEKEHEAEKERRQTGIPLNEKMVAVLKLLAEEAGVGCPF